MNKRAENKIQGIIIGMLTASLFMVFFSTIILSNFGSNYDQTGMNLDDIDKYNIGSNITEDIDAANTLVDQATVDPNAFDFFSSIYNSVLTPFKFVYQSYTTGKTVMQGLSDDLQLPSVFIDYFVTVFSIIVIIGIVLIKFYLGRRK